MTWLDALILGAVEGITEFLPVSSTAHLVLTADLLNITRTPALEAFEVIVQWGAILAVLFLYRRTLVENFSFSLWFKLGVAFVPTGLAGLLLYSWIKSFFTPLATVILMAVTGAVFIIIERFYQEKEHHLENAEDLPVGKAFGVGVAQTFALLPGVSRSGATIVGGLLLGMKRKAAVEFSFLLAVPTMTVAAAYEIYKGWGELSVESWEATGLGLLAAFLFAVLAIKGFLAFISRFSFVPFGIYLILSAGIYFWVVLA